MNFRRIRGHSEPIDLIKTKSIKLRDLHGKVCFKQFDTGSMLRLNLEYDGKPVSFTEEIVLVHYKIAGENSIDDDQVICDCHNKPIVTQAKTKQDGSIVEFVIDEDVLNVNIDITTKIKAEIVIVNEIEKARITAPSLLFSLEPSISFNIPGMNLMPNYLTDSEGQDLVDQNGNLITY